MSSQADLLDRLRHHRRQVADLTGHLFTRPGTATMRLARAGLEQVEREGGSGFACFAPRYELLERAGWEIASLQGAQ